MRKVVISFEDIVYIDVFCDAFKIKFERESFYIIEIKINGIWFNSMNQIESSYPPVIKIYELKYVKN